MLSKPRHFLSLLDYSATEINTLLQRASELKALRRRGDNYAPFQNKVLGMIFEKSSTRTRVSFEAGMIQLGGNAIFLSPHDTHLGRGEPIEDTARVVSSMVDIIMIRTFAHATIERFAKHSSVSIINALTDYNHPCQLLADMLTFQEQRGSIKGKTVAWIGDGNNMCNSYMEAALQLDFQLRIACPEGFEPDQTLLQRCADRVELSRDPYAAANQADLVTTDTWASMGQEEEKQAREAAFADFQVNADVMARAKPEALFLHCLPAYREQEVSTDVIDGPQSQIWEQAENRLHAQKALIEYLLTRSPRKFHDKHLR